MSQDNVIRGNWELQGMTGYFELALHIPKWHGWLEQCGQRMDMNMNMVIAQNNVWGSGYDTAGSWVAEGYTHHNHVFFKKQYLGAHSVTYQGTYVGGAHPRVTGKWWMSGDQGSFELTQQAHEHHWYPKYEPEVVEFNEDEYWTEEVVTEEIVTEEVVEEYY